MMLGLLQQRPAKCPGSPASCTGAIPVHTTQGGRRKTKVQWLCSMSGGWTDERPLEQWATLDQWTRVVPKAKAGPLGEGGTYGLGLNR